MATNELIGKDEQIVIFLIQLYAFEKVSDD